MCLLSILYGKFLWVFFFFPRVGAVLDCAGPLALGNIYVYLFMKFKGNEKKKLILITKSKVSVLIIELMLKEQNI